MPGANWIALALGFGTFVTVALILAALAETARLVWPCRAREARAEPYLIGFAAGLFVAACVGGAAPQLSDGIPPAFASNVAAADGDPAPAAESGEPTSHNPPGPFAGPGGSA